MEYALQLLVIVAGTLWLGQWLVNTFHWSPVVLVLALFLGIILGIGTLRYRMQNETQKDPAGRTAPKKHQSDILKPHQKLSGFPDEKDPGHDS